MIHSGILRQLERESNYFKNYGSGIVWKDEKAKRTSTLSMRINLIITLFLVYRQPRE